jgi:type III secretion protein D
MTSQHYELRVLQGIHEEARCAVEDGASIGSDPACDIVLSDEGIAPLAGHLYFQSEGWSLHSSENNTNISTPWNQAISLGAAWITVAAEGAPWIFVPSEQSTNGSSASADLENRLESVEEENPLYETLHTPKNEIKQTRSWPTVILFLAISLVILSAIVLFIVSDNPSSPNNSTSSSSSEQSLGKISAALERLGVSSSLHVTLSKTGNVTVSGWAKDRAQYEAIASAMAQIWPMPALRISLESEAIMAARATLQRFSVKYDPLYQGNGRLEITGVASSARERATALDAVRAQLPGMTIFGNAIELSQEVGDQLSKKLSSLGIYGVTLTWYPGHLTVQPPSLDEAQSELLEKTITEFNERYWNLAQLGAEPSPTIADSVPFEIRSVIGGPQPFIVLADGSKLLVGGTYKRYQLIAVEDSRIIFDGPRRAIVTR